jgi:hypothetical protein
MKSAFGVEHISKSLVPGHIGARGGKYIKASQLTTKEKAGMSTHLKRKARFRRLGANERKLP